MEFDVNRIREDFPILKQKIYKKPLAYLDNAATMQMPRPVSEAVAAYYSSSHANIHRGIHKLSEQATAKVEKVREQIGRFIGAGQSREIIFTSGTTGSINLLAHSIECSHWLKEGDEILVTAMEHHSNYVPWQMLCERTGAVLREIPFDEEGNLNMALYRDRLSEATKIVAVCAVSNVLGTVNPLDEIIACAHQCGAYVVIDAAQGMRHRLWNMQELDCDFFAFSGHKIGAPTGIGILYGKEHLLDELQPGNFGGGMVDRVNLDRTTFDVLPFKFEAGTPNIGGVIGLAEAVRYLESIGLEKVSAYEKTLLNRVENELKKDTRIEIVGNPDSREGAVSFNMKGLISYDVAALLDKLGVEVRSGHHCAQPLLRCYGLKGAVRVSPAFYNNFAEIEQFLDGIKRIEDVCRRNRI